MALSTVQIEWIFKQLNLRTLPSMAGNVAKQLMAEQAGVEAALQKEYVLAKGCEALAGDEVKQKASDEAIAEQEEIDSMDRS